MAEEGKKPVDKDDLVVTKDDQLEFEPVKKAEKKSGSGAKLFFGLVIVTAVAGGAAWYLFGDKLTPEARQDEVPFIRADMAPIKVRPKNPGGMDIPDQDKLVYDRFGGKEEMPRVERLLPPPEKLQEPPKLEEKAEGVMTTDPKVMETAEGATPDGVQKVEETAKTPEPPKVEEKPKDLGESVKEALKEEQAKAEVPKVEAPKAPPALPKVGDGSYAIQLAAVRSEDKARSEWSRLQKANKDLLGDLTLKVVKADLGAKGIFYRIRAVPLATEAEARALCKKLAERKVGCLMVRGDQ